MTAAPFRLVEIDDMMARKPGSPAITAKTPAVVMYVANASHIGGGNRSLMDIIMGINRSRFEPVLIAPGQGALVDWAAATGVPCEIIPDGDWEGRRSLLRRTALLTAAMMRTRTSIVHTAAHTCYRAAGIAARLCGVRRVCHLGYPPAAGELEWSFQAPPDAVVACHDGQALEVQARVTAIAPTARLVSIQNGVDVRRFTPSLPSDSLPDWHPGRPVVMIVGHLSEVKGHPTFFEAAARVAAHEDASFVALGGEHASPGYRMVLEAKVAELGISERVQFLGWQPHVEQVLRAADIVVMPSLSEGLPMAILEAMACAAPIVATPVGGIPEAITDGVTGLLIPPSDAGALADAIVRLLRDRPLAKRLGAQARAEAVGHFSINRMVADVERVYDELASSGPKAATTSEMAIA
jgi:glycosyltransferase involved in cell wall biosynthesis